jgi:hypothetical protein
MTKEYILERVAKLLALSTSPNEHEAAAALAKAHAMLAEHNLSLSEVNVDNGDPVIEEIGHMTAESKVGAQWVRQIWQGTCKLYFCEYAYNRGNHRTHHWIIGSTANSKTACAMAEYLTKTIIRLANEASKSHADPYVSKGRFNNSFRTGCAMRVISRMRDMRREAETPSKKNPSNLPALYKQTQAALDDYSKNTLNTSTNKSRAISASSGAGYKAGREAGDSVGLHTQVGKNSSTRSISNDHANG